MNRIVDFICKRDFTIETQRARDLVQYSACLSNPPSPSIQLKFNDPCQS